MKNFILKIDNIEKMSKLVERHSLSKHTHRMRGQYQIYQHLCNESIRGEEKATRAKKYFEEMMAEKLPSLMKNMNLHIQEVQ